MRCWTPALDIERVVLKRTVIAKYLSNVVTKTYGEILKYSS
jgi:hypothetical protein